MGLLIFQAYRIASGLLVILKVGMTALGTCPWGQKRPLHLRSSQSCGNMFLRADLRRILKFSDHIEERRRFDLSVVK